MAAKEKLTAHKEAFHPIQKRGNGYVVIARSTGEPLSNHPLPKADAQAQLRAVEAHKHG